MSEALGTCPTQAILECQAGIRYLRTKQFSHSLVIHYLMGEIKATVLRTLRPVMPKEARREDSVVSLRMPGSEATHLEGLADIYFIPAGDGNLCSWGP